MERDPVPEDFVGKTIVEVDASACNIWRFRFSDGSTIAIEAEDYFGVPVMQVCRGCTT